MQVSVNHFASSQISEINNRTEDKMYIVRRF